MPAETAIDPVCGMTVKTSTHLRTDYKGDTYYFCAPGCLAKFQADPERFLHPQPAAAPSPADMDAIYTCPMHPEIRQKGPGACPICGMALEPAMVTLDEGPNPELVDMSRRLWIAGALSLPIVAYAMAQMFDAGLAHLGPRASLVANWIQLALATPVVLWAGWPFF